MPYATRNLQPGSTARSVGGRVLLQWRRIAAYLENTVLRLIASVAISAPVQHATVRLQRVADFDSSRSNVTAFQRSARAREFGVGSVHRL
jgi:hypothetical protein